MTDAQQVQTQQVLMASDAQQVQMQQVQTLQVLMASDAQQVQAPDAQQASGAQLYAIQGQSMGPTTHGARDIMWGALDLPGSSEVTHAVHPTQCIATVPLLMHTVTAVRAVAAVANACQQQQLSPVLIRKEAAPAAPCDTGGDEACHCGGEGYDAASAMATQEPSDMSGEEASEAEEPTAEPSDTRPPVTKHPIPAARVGWRRHRGMGRKFNGREQLMSAYPAICSAAFRKKVSKLIMPCTTNGSTDSGP